MSENNDEMRHLSENALQVSRAALMDCRRGPKRSPDTDFVIVIETKEHPDFPPFHFWIGAAQLRSLVAQAEHDLGPSHLERRQILEALERIERQLEN